MNYMIVGFLLISFWLNVEVGKGTIDLLPDIMGYVLIAMGIKRVFEGKEIESKIIRNIGMIAIVSILMAIMNVLHIQYTMRMYYHFLLLLNGLGYLY